MNEDNMYTNQGSSPEGSVPANEPSTGAPASTPSYLTGESYQAADRPAQERPTRTYPWPPQAGSDPSFYPESSYQPQVPSAPKPPKQSRTWVIPLVICIIICLTVIISVVSCSASVLTLADSVGATTPQTANPTVAVIYIDSDIQYDDSACSPEGLKVLLDEAESDSNIVAVVLRVDSGGGTATAGEEMATYLNEFRTRSGKPVVVSSASCNASAAYEISSQADYIFTAKSTAIGAIGTAMQLVDYSSLMDMLGIKMTNITSADSKDSTYGTRALTDEEKAYYQRQVDQINEEFIATVASGRGMTVDQVRALANGLTYTGIDAVSNGLADSIGTLEDAEDKAADLAHVGSYYTYELYLSDDGLTSMLSALAGSQSQSTALSSDSIKEYSNVAAVQ